MWVKGRQQSGYYTWKLFESIRYKVDCYLIKYPPGSSIAPHCDPVQSGRHYRLNIILKNGTGGKFHCVGPHFRFWRVVIFRPDLYTHWVDTVGEKSRVVFSVGWVKNN